MLLLLFSLQRLQTVGSNSKVDVSLALDASKLVAQVPQNSSNNGVNQKSPCSSAHTASCQGGGGGSSSASAASASANSSGYPYMDYNGDIGRPLGQHQQVPKRADGKRVCYTPAG